MAVAFHGRFFLLMQAFFSVAIQTPDEEIKGKINQNLKLKSTTMKHTIF